MLPSTATPICCVLLQNNCSYDMPPEFGALPFYIELKNVRESRISLKLLQIKKLRKFHCNSCP